MAPFNYTLPVAFVADRREYCGRAGRLSYYVAGPPDAPPLLLIHSINAAASAYEMRPIVEAFRETRRVYVPDLPGFGFSDRSVRAYTVALYVAAIEDLLDCIVADRGEAPVDALALSLGSEFLARAADSRPQRFRTVAFVSPTGLGGGLPRRGPEGGTLAIPFMREFFSFPLWSRTLFDLLTSRPSIRYFLARTFGSDAAVDAGMLEYDFLTARQPGAEHAPYVFVSGGLFSADIERVYTRLTLPAWLAYGTRGEFNDLRRLGVLQKRPNWQITRFNTGALPHFEEPGAFAAQYARFVR
jgi:pimeloyl-ACP methyl ester carboxylesterase